MNVLGLKIIGHDPGASIIAGGRIVAISEERLNRQKHSTDEFPFLSIQYCLDTLKLSPGDIDLVVMDHAAQSDEAATLALFRKKNKFDFSKAEVIAINHHNAHAASAFYCSPFNEAAIMVVDGIGSKVQTHLGDFVETETLYRGIGIEMQQIQKTLHKDFYQPIIETFGIGKLYSLITRRILKFGRYNEGKTMGLASYGDAARLFKKIPKEKWVRELNGHFVCNPKIAYPGSSPFNFRYVYHSILKFLQSIGDPMARPVFEEIRLPFKPRPDGYVLPDETYSDVAAAVQDIIEDIFLGLSRTLFSVTGSKNLCIAGGCGLNGVSNNKILADGRFTGIFIQPASSDAGIPLGAALFGYHAHLKQPRTYAMKHASLGRTYTDNEIAEVLKANFDISYSKSKNIASDVATLIEGQKIIGWFQGGSEYGPRALGNRSILCNPRRKEMKDILNKRVKHREMWRPFAASVLKEEVHAFFELPYHESPFMLLVPTIKKEVQSRMEALVHVDNTCRIQTLTREDNGIYYELVDAFHKRTGIPLILNTSFNLAGEPIVESPNDALKCFLSTEMDYLVMGEYIIQKKAK